MLFTRLEAPLAKWPARAETWIDALPREILRRTTVSSFPGRSTSWTRTRRLGWPPSEFVVKPPVRRDDHLAIQTFSWIVQTAATIARDAAVPRTREQKAARSALAVAFGLLQHPILSESIAHKPSSSELQALRAIGSPWRELAAVGSHLITLSREHLGNLASELIAPDPDLAWRLFHLAVLGELLHALRTAGATVASVRPLGAARPGPSYKVIDADDREWELWFEAAGAWGHHERDEPYREVASAVPGAGGALGCDLMLLRPDEAALLLECKYSRDPGVVARAGYQQALAYATEAYGNLASDITSVVIGPDEVVLAPRFTSCLPGTVGIAPASSLPAVIEHALVR